MDSNILERVFTSSINVAYNKNVGLFVKTIAPQLNERVLLNLSKITRTKIDHVEDGIRVRFYEGQYQVAKSKRFETVEDANKWLFELLKPFNSQN
jgi:hypothetical protein